MSVTNFALFSQGNDRRRSYQLKSQNLYFCSRFFLQSRIVFWQLQMILLDCMVVLAVTDVAFSFTEY